MCGVLLRCKMCRNIVGGKYMLSSSGSGFTLILSHSCSSHLHMCAVDPRTMHRPRPMHIQRLRVRVLLVLGPVWRFGNFSAPPLSQRSRNRLRLWTFFYTTVVSGVAVVDGVVVVAFR